MAPADQNLCGEILAPTWAARSTLSTREYDFRSRPPLNAIDEDTVPDTTSARAHVGGET